MRTLAEVVIFGLQPHSIGWWLLMFVGLVIAVAIVYAIMRTLDSPPWMYKAAAVVALVLALVLTILFFFGGT